MKRSELCGTVCKLCYDGIDHCAYCKVEEGVGPYGWPFPNNVVTDEDEVVTDEDRE
jgi:hypothetical protein